MIAAEALGAYGRLIEAYEADLPPHRSARLVREGSRRLSTLEDFLAPRGLLEATEDDLRAWTRSCHISRSSAKVHTYAALLFDFYEWARLHQLIAANPAQMLRRHRARWHLTPVPNPDEPPRTLGDAVTAYVWDRRQRGELNDKSARGLASRLKMLTNVAGDDLPIGDFDRRAVLNFQRATGDQASGSRRAYLSTVRVFSQWAIAEGLLNVDPTIGIAPVKEPRRVPRALAEADVTRLLRAASEDPRDLALVWLMVGCGVRCIEVSRLELADYDDRARTVLVQGKAGHERLLPVPAAATSALNAYLATVPRLPGPLLRPSHLAGANREAHLSSQYVSKVVNDLMIKAGIKHPGRRGVSAHALRHTCASDVLDRCGNVRTVQAILGHASLATTEIYLRRADLGQMRDALEGRSYGTETLEGDR